MRLDVGSAGYRCPGVAQRHHHDRRKATPAYAPGATHAPHHPTKEWVDKISKMHLFDEGWNKLRERIFENQKRLGVIPKDTKMSPWPKDVLKEWDQLTEDEKKLYIRQGTRMVLRH